MNDPHDAWDEHRINWQVGGYTEAAVRWATEAVLGSLIAVQIEGLPAGMPESSDVKFGESVRRWRPQWAPAFIDALRDAVKKEMSNRLMSIAAVEVTAENALSQVLTLMWNQHNSRPLAPGAARPFVKTLMWKPFKRPMFYAGIPGRVVGDREGPNRVTWIDQTLNNYSIMWGPNSTDDDRKYIAECILRHRFQDDDTLTLFIEPMAEELKAAPEAWALDTLDLSTWILEQAKLDAPG